MRKRNMNTLIMPLHHNTCERGRVCQVRECTEEQEVAHRFQVSDTLACCVPGLRAQQTLLLENEARADEDTAEYGEDDANNLRGDDRWSTEGFVGNAEDQAITLRLLGA
jgi:hypothetical protein